MHVTSILNHKGGVGKSTIATNIAGYFANKGEKVLIGDFDVQQSSQTWLDLRPENTAHISNWVIENGHLISPPDGTSHIIIDSSAGLTGNSLDRIVSMSDKIIIPLKPGIFDMLSTQSFLEEVIEIINSKEKEIKLCIIGSMVDNRTKATEQLSKFLNSLGLDSPTNIRQAQIYIHLAAHGLSLFDAKTDAFDKEKEQWIPLIEWIEQ